ncbi:integrin beta-5-like [Bolinopsis microptera]|uniref:integrin beta-5-like n=1 Tax=Bolinopsis microptera TaxID=2820187 RepID=UPI00307A3577
MLLNPLQLILAAVLFASTHSIFCSDNQPYCSGGKICVHNECRRYRTNIDCSTSGGKCPRGYCCMNQGSSSAGICVRKLNFRLRIGDYCNRQATCDYCQCQPGLVCAKNGFQFFPEAVYTCQENDTFTEQEGDCSEDEQCASDRCCSSSKCKPKKKK